MHSNRTPDVFFNVNADISDFWTIRVRVLRSPLVTDDVFYRVNRLLVSEYSSTKIPIINQFSPLSSTTLVQAPTLELRFLQGQGLERSKDVLESLYSHRSVHAILCLLSAAETINEKPDSISKYTESKCVRYLRVKSLNKSFSSENTTDDVCEVDIQNTNSFKAPMYNFMKLIIFELISASRVAVPVMSGEKGLLMSRGKSGIARAKKKSGDLLLLAGCPYAAFLAYTDCIDLTKSIVGEVLLPAACLEAQAATLVRYTDILRQNTITSDYTHPPEIEVLMKEVPKKWPIAAFTMNILPVTHLDPNTDSVYSVNQAIGFKDVIGASQEINVLSNLQMIVLNYLKESIQLYNKSNSNLIILSAEAMLRKARFLGRYGDRHSCLETLQELINKCTTPHDTLAYMIAAGSVAMSIGYYRHFSLYLMLDILIKNQKGIQFDEKDVSVICLATPWFFLAPLRCGSCSLKRYELSSFEQDIMYICLTLEHTSSIHPDTWNTRVRFTRPSILRTYERQSWNHLQKNKSKVSLRKQSKLVNYPIDWPSLQLTTLSLLSRAASQTNNIESVVSCILSMFSLKLTTTEEQEDLLIESLLDELNKLNYPLSLPPTLAFKSPNKSDKYLSFVGGSGNGLGHMTPALIDVRVINNQPCLFNNQIKYWEIIKKKQKLNTDVTISMSKKIKPVTDVFLFSPWQKSEIKSSETSTSKDIDDIKTYWIKDEIKRLVFTISNPWKVPIVLEGVKAIFAGADIDVHPCTLEIPGESENFEFEVNVVPLKEGLAHFLGFEYSIFNQRLYNKQYILYDTKTTQNFFKSYLKSKLEDIISDPSVKDPQDMLRSSSLASFQIIDKPPDLSLLRINTAEQFGITIQNNGSDQKTLNLEIIFLGSSAFDIWIKHFESSDSLSSEMLLCHHKSCSDESSAFHLNPKRPIQIFSNQIDSSVVTSYKVIPDVYTPNFLCFSSIDMKSSSLIEIPVDSNYSAQSPQTTICIRYSVSSSASYFRYMLFPLVLTERPEIFIVSVKTDYTIQQDGFSDVQDFLTEESYSNSTIQAVRDAVANQNISIDGNTAYIVTELQNDADEIIECFTVPDAVLPVSSISCARKSKTRWVLPVPREPIMRRSDDLGHDFILRFRVRNFIGNLKSKESSQNELAKIYKDMGPSLIQIKWSLSTNESEPLRPATSVVLTISTITTTVVSQYKILVIPKIIINSCRMSPISWFPSLESPMLTGNENEFRVWLVPTRPGLYTFYLCAICFSTTTDPTLIFHNKHVILNVDP